MHPRERTRIRNTGLESDCFANFYVDKTKAMLCYKFKSKHTEFIIDIFFELK